MIFSLSWPTVRPIAPAIETAKKVTVENIATADQSSPSMVELVESCQRSPRPDRQAFSLLVRRYQVYVDRLLYQLAPDWSDRSDLSQEVWIRVYRHIRRLNEPAKFKSWLGRIATNLFYDELRRRKRLDAAISLDAPRLLDHDPIDWEIAAVGPGPVDSLLTEEFYDWFKVAIAALPESFRLTIVMREIEGLTYEEIAETTGVSLGTVKSRIARARNRLQAELQKYLEISPSQ